MLKNLTSKKTNLNFNKNNFLDYIPEKNPEILFRINPTDTNAAAVIELSRNDIFTFIAHLFFKAPTVTKIKLDPVGSFAFSLIDGSLTVYEISSILIKKYPSAGDNLYPRLTAFISSLYSKGLIRFRRH